MSSKRTWIDVEEKRHVTRYRYHLLTFKMPKIHHFWMVENVLKLKLKSKKMGSQRVKKKLLMVRNIFFSLKINPWFYFNLVDIEFVMYNEFDSHQMANALRLESNTMEESMPEATVSLKQILSIIVNWFVRQLIIVTFLHLLLISKDVGSKELSKKKFLMEIMSQEELIAKKKVSTNLIISQN